MIKVDSLALGLIDISNKYSSFSTIFISSLRKETAGDSRIMSSAHINILMQTNLLKQLNLLLDFLLVISST